MDKLSQTESVLQLEGVKLVGCFFADNSALLASSKFGFQKVLNGMQLHVTLLE